MPLPRQDIYTIDDILALPEGTRAELIDGELFMMSASSITHQRILGFLYSSINSYIKSKNGPCEVFMAPVAVYLNKDNKTYVEPDIFVVCDDEKTKDDDGCYGAPDLVIEIVSPSSKQMDYITKLNKYRTAGVREYWIVDPLSNTITVYSFEKDIWAGHFTFVDNVKVNLYEDLYLDFSQLNIQPK